MIKHFSKIFLLIIISFSLCACDKDDKVVDVFENYSEENSYNDLPPFFIQFIDVGQGDAALVQCDGHYMLIDGGDTYAGQNVYDVLSEAAIKKLDILAVSHLHRDHFGGLTTAITALSGSLPIGLTISNDDYSTVKEFPDFEQELARMDSRITIPKAGTSYELGDANVEIIDVTSKEENDSLVLMITYEKTRFLFTGDIQKNGQKRVADYLAETMQNEFNGESLIKMPHHGAYNDYYGFQDSDLNRLLTEYDPTYFVISVGANNKYNHPHSQTIELLEDYVLKARDWEWSEHVFRTDQQGDIYVYSDGTSIFIEVE